MSRHLGLEVCIVSVNGRRHSKYKFLTFHRTLPMFDKTAYNFKGLHSGRTSLVLSESVQPMEDNIDLLLTENFVYKLLCAVLSKSTAPAASTTLTQSSLLDLFGRQSESGENLRHDLYDNIIHSCSESDGCIDTESGEEALNGLEQIDQGIVTRTDVLYSLRCSDIIRIYIYGNREGDLQRARPHKRQTLLSQVTMAMECILESKNGSKVLSNWTYYTDTFTKGAVGRKRI
jgi:hypothetical protein